MSKSNVNPSHYNVAGRERQGEDIPQARNKQEHAESLARRRAEKGAASQKIAVDRSAAPTSPPLPEEPHAFGFEPTFNPTYPVFSENAYGWVSSWRLDGRGGRASHDGALSGRPCRSDHVRSRPCFGNTP